MSEQTARPANPVRATDDPAAQPALTPLHAAALAENAALPGPTTLEDRLTLAERFMQTHESRLVALERAVGLMAPMAQSIADLLPGGAPIGAVIATLPDVIGKINAVIDVLDRHFGGKLALPEQFPPAAAVT